MAKVPVKKTAAKNPSPKPGKDVIYLDVDDEITAIIDKVDNAKQKIVALVLPKRAAMLQSTVNMRLLKRSATTAGKSVVLITSEHALMPLAGAAGIHVAKNLQSKPAIPAAPHAEADSVMDADEMADSADLDDQPQKLDYNEAVGDLAASRDEPEEIALDDDDEDDGAEDTVPAAAAAGASKAKAKGGKGLGVPNFDRFRMLLLFGGGALVLLIIFLILAITVLPKATVNIKTTSTPVSLDTDYTASGTAKELDEAKKIIPSLLKTSDQISNQSVTATGQQNNGEKATGTATMSGQDCDPPFTTPDNVPSGTGFTTSGLSFKTQSSAKFSLDSASGSCVYYKSNAVDIVALAAGAKYNTSFSNASVRSGVSASGSASGGTDNNITILTQQDLDGAKAKISSADSDKFSKDFQKQLSDQGLYIIGSTLKIADPVITSTPSVGQQASTAQVSIKITYSVLAVQKTNLQKAVTDALNKQVDQKKEKLSDDDVLNGLQITVQNQQPNTPNATLSLSKDTTAIPILDENAIKSQLKGKKENEIKEFINSYPGVKDVDVKFSPFWVSHAPGNTGKIKIVEQQVSGSSSGQ
jgi:hypothetical protein